FFVSSRRRHTRSTRDWSSDVCSSDLVQERNLRDYGVPRLEDIPELHLKLLSTPNRPTGAGQMATPIVAPVIAAAVYAASGARVRHTPFLPERVLTALG